MKRTCKKKLDWLICLVRMDVFFKHCSSYWKGTRSHSCFFTLHLDNTFEHSVVINTQTIKVGYRISLVMLRHSEKEYIRPNSDIKLFYENKKNMISISESCKLFSR